MSTATAVITGWSVVSPYGIGQDAFVAGLRAGTRPRTTLSADPVEAADGCAGLVPDFDIRAVLGKKGTRSMDRVTALAVSAVGDFLSSPRAAGVVGDGLDTALVLGTTTGSAQSMMDFTRTSLVAEKPIYVDPALMPNAVMNCAAGQCAIWHQLKGPNTTIAGGRAAGLFALGYARRLLAGGRAGKVLCGCAEEYSRARSWLEHHSRGPDVEATLAEGSVVLLVEPADAVTADRPALAEVLAVESRVDVDDDPRAALTTCVQVALDRSGVDRTEVWAAVPASGPGPVGAHERRALTELFGAAVVDRVPGTAGLGDAGAASAGFQIAAVLAAAHHAVGAAGRIALVTSADGDGTVVCAVLRLSDGPR